MVTFSRTWEEETRKYLTEVKAELNAIEKQINELMIKRNSLAHEADAFETALQSRLKRTGRQESMKSDWHAQLAQQKNTKERLKRIAEKENGVIKVGVATDLLYHLGLIRSKSRSNAYRVVYGLLQDMTEAGEFQKIAPSVFRLVGSQQSLPTIVPDTPIVNPVPITQSISEAVSKMLANNLIAKPVHEA